MTLSEFLKLQAPVLSEPEERDAAAIRKSRDAYAAALEPMRPVESDLASRVIAKEAVRAGDDYYSGDQLEASEHAANDLRVLREGAWLHGYRDRRLDAFAGGPGVNHLAHWLAMCDTVLAHEQTLDNVAWPARARYVGRPGFTVIDGQRLKPGDVVSLTRERFRAFADRFTLVEQEQVTT